MSNEEQDAAMVRLVRQRSETKKQSALLESELRVAGQSLWEIGSSLKAIRGAREFVGTAASILPQVNKAPEICGLAQVKRMLEELDGLKNSLIQLNRTAQELGID